MSTVFTPLTKGFSWNISTTDTNGAPLPDGEVNVASAIGIRAEGDSTHVPGNYQYLVVLGPNVSSVTLAQVLASKVPAGGNYWAAVDQTDAMNGTTMTSSWTAEIPFSIPPQIVRPAAPTNFTIA